MGKSSRKDRKSNGSAIDVKCRPVDGDACSAPLLLAFPGGPPPSSLLCNTAELQQYIGGREGSTKRAATAAIEGIEWQGSSRIESSCNAKYLVGVYKADKSKLYLVDAGQVVGMNLKKKGEAEAEAAKEQAAVKRHAEDAPALHRGLAKQALIENFGSRRKASEEATKRANLVSGDSILSKDAVLTNLRGTAEALPEGASGGGVLRPPFNLQAKELHDCYPIDGLAPQQELKSMAVQGKGLIQSARKNEPPYWCADDSFVWSLALQHGHVGLSDQDCGAALLHLSYMIALHGMGKVLGDTESARTKLTNEGATTQLADGLLERFTEIQREGGGIKHKRTPELEDKLLLYIAALSLRLSQYLVAVDRLAAQLKMSAVELRKYFSILGCKPSSKRKMGETDSSDKSMQKNTMKLSLPLKFPDPPRKQQR